LWRLYEPQGRIPFHHFPHAIGECEDEFCASKASKGGAKIRHTNRRTALYTQRGKLLVRDVLHTWDSCDNKVLRSQVLLQGQAIAKLAPAINSTKSLRNVEQLYRISYSPMANRCGDSLARRGRHLLFRVARCLQERNAVSGAYNHAVHLKTRTKMMTEWADFLKQTQRGAGVLSFSEGLAYRTSRSFRLLFGAPHIFGAPHSSLLKSTTSIPSVIAGKDCSPHSG
jgi:hypothetical protein